MYQRILNKLDVDILSEELYLKGVDRCVIERLTGIVEVLDDSYGAMRNSHSMGGYVLFFEDKQTYEDAFSKIIEFYHLDEKNYEYSEIISTDMKNKQEWREELYMLSSDDALVFIHPRGVGDNG